MKLLPIQKKLRAMSDPSIAVQSQRFFKNGKGEYGEGDKFLGVRVPTIRALAKKYKDLTTTDMWSILKSIYHEERLLALVLLVARFRQADDTEKHTIYTTYLRSTQYINNWDLVDSSAYQILGSYLVDNDRRILETLTSSGNLWERRIAVIATYQFIKRDEFDDTLKLAKLLLSDDEDLIHKAVGWMLREVGNRDRNVEREFLLEHYQSMPRTMLRYAIEKFDHVERKRFLRAEM